MLTASSSAQVLVFSLSNVVHLIL